jgi:hypothetical protein
MDKDIKSIKVAFVQEVAKDEYETETLWCDIDGENFIVDNIPMIAKRISLGDTIKAEFDEEEKRYYFDDFVLTSGNSTIRIFFYNNDLIELTRKWLNNVGCESEVLLARSTVAVNIPKEIDYVPIRNYLEEGEKNKKWVYEESCLEHQY